MWTIGLIDDADIWVVHAMCLVSRLQCTLELPKLTCFAAHSYQYSFEPNHNWSALYAPAREIQAYLERVAKKFSADRYIKLAHQVEECRWDDTMAKWNVSVKNLNTGEIIQDQSDVVISARGNLNNPAWPEIDGLKKFKGELMHSAKWNERYDLILGSRVALTTM
jgi:cation diffusion facilitator CzcD-associated flavoprotein CzcO